jgi:transposase
VKRSPELFEIVVDAIKSGTPLREIAKRAGISHQTAKRWAEEAGVLPTKEQHDAAARARALVERSQRTAAPEEPEPDDEEIDTDSADLRPLARRLLKKTLKIVASAEREGNYTAAQRALRDASASITPLIARLEKLYGDDDSVIRIPRADVERLMLGMRDRAAAICDRPLLCAACSRELSIAWSEGNDANGK